MLIRTGVLPTKLVGVPADCAASGDCRRRAVAGIDEVTIDAHIGEELVPLPEGGRYLGFIFARAQEPGKVESALRGALKRLSFEIVPRETLITRAKEDRCFSTSSRRYL